MTRRSGAVRIFLYNWPVYSFTWTLALATVALSRFVPAFAAWPIAIGACVALAWSFASLLVSFYVYDASALVSGSWVAKLIETSMPWATIHAGLDAEVELDAVMRGQCVARLDIFDPQIMTSPSITRARSVTPQAHEALRCSPRALALGDETCSAIVVAFTAHEIRDQRAREAFFCELHRALRPGGKALIVEHLRDFANFVSFGPGYLHFVSRSEWLRLAAHANFAIASETRVTPWVMALTLERRP